MRHCNLWHIYIRNLPLWHLFEERPSFLVVWFGTTQNDAQDSCSCHQTARTRPGSDVIASPRGSKSPVGRSNVLRVLSCLPSPGVRFPSCNVVRLFVIAEHVSGADYCKCLKPSDTFLFYFTSVRNAPVSEVTRIQAHPMKRKRFSIGHGNTLAPTFSHGVRVQIWMLLWSKTENVSTTM
jgi:hypothetical protein